MKLVRILCVMVCVGVCIAKTNEEVCNQPSTNPHKSSKSTQQCNNQEHEGNLEGSSDNSNQYTSALKEENQRSLHENEEESTEGKADSVSTLKQEGDLESFISKGSISIVYFYKKNKRGEQTHFISEFSKAATDLVQYNIRLANVDCIGYPVMPYCGPDKVDHFAYGFRDGQEKIAFPLDTLFNSNAIVASALHLALINTVPILQTATERRDLEVRCKGRCNIVFAYLRTLGTLEHRMFLEVAYAHQDDFMFAITTYTAGTLGLTSMLPPEGERESYVWALHCQDKRMDQDCIVSQYREITYGSMLNNFLQDLRLPLWHELSTSGGSSELVTPYDESDLPWVILVYDDTCQNRVKDLAPHLAQLLRGSVVLLTLNLDTAGDAVLAKLWLSRHSLAPPSIAFLQPGQEDWASHLNDYDDPLTWVKEQLEFIQRGDNEEDQQEYLPVQPLEELQQDDETVLGMVSEETFINIPVLAGQDAFNTVLTSDVLPVIAFYLSWDSVSNALLQHLSIVVPALTVHKSGATVYRVNCFDYPYFCDDMGIYSYPVLRMYPRDRNNITYDGQIHHDYILKTILLLEKKLPLELGTMREVEALMKLDKEIHPACSFVNAATVAIFPSAQEAGAFKKAALDLQSTHLLGLHISAQATKSLCGSEDGCLVVSKPSDRFQQRKILIDNLHKSQAIVNFIKQTSPLVLGELDPERYHLLVGEEDEDAENLHKYLVILFLPITTTRQGTEDGRITVDMNAVVAEDDWGNKVGHLAAEMSEPGFVFSWLSYEDPLAVELLAAYGLDGSVRSLVALNKTPSTTTLHVFPTTNTTLSAFRDWLVKLRSHQLSVTAELPKGDWRPQMEGFDFLKFLREDQDRDAEDQLIMEMEADLTSSNPSLSGANDDAKKTIHDEF